MFLKQMHSLMHFSTTTVQTTAALIRCKRYEHKPKMIILEGEMIKKLLNLKKKWWKTQESIEATNTELLL